MSELNSETLQPITDQRLEALRRIATEPTPGNEVRWREGKGNREYPYTDPAYVIATLNQIFDHDWTFIADNEELFYFREQPFEVKVRGKLIVKLGNHTIIKTQYGAQPIEFITSKQTGAIIKPVSIADAFKAAASDALKKCASELGIAHDIYDSDSYLYKGQRNQQQGSRSNGQSKSQTTNKPANLIDEQTAEGIIQFWPEYGVQRNGELVPLTVYIRENKNVSDLYSLDSESGKRLLAGLREKANGAQKGEPQIKQEKEKGTGLDQWRCTQESKGSRKIAMEVLNSTNRLEDSGVTEEQWRKELHQMFPEYEPPISRKTLSVQECDLWIGFMNNWSESREKKGA